MNFNGTFEKIQQFNSDFSISPRPNQIRITPDSKYVVETDSSNGGGMISYKLNSDHTLTKVHSIALREGSGEDMAMTPDGKFAITRYLRWQGGSMFLVVKINPDGTLEYLPEKDLIVSGSVSAMAFLPPYQDYLSTSWYLY